MNLKEYIASGIIEAYVLGLATPEERMEFEAMCAQHYEVRAAREAFELSLENTLVAEAVAPPSSLKESLFARLDAEVSERASSSAPEPQAPVRRMNPWKWAAAASLLLTAGALIWAWSAQQKYQAALAENQEVRSELQQAQRSLAGYQSDAGRLQDPSLKMARLQGTAVAPGAGATVYWDSTSKDVYLLINNLPEPPSGKQYQLWALLDGQPIDLGVFDMQLRQRRLLVKMKNTRGAQAFAITLEPEGGSVNPTLEQMYVLGNL